MDVNVVREVKVAKLKRKAIVPYSQEDLKAMLRVLKHSMPYSRSGKQVSSHCLNLVERNRAILLMLLDTGVRSSELVALKISNSDLKNRRIPFSEAQLNWRSAWQFGGKDTKLLGDGGWQKLARAQVTFNLDRRSR